MRNSEGNNLNIQETSNIDLTQGNRQGANVNQFGKSLKNYICEFCETVSIQGLAYMVKNISFLERIWWILIFTVGVSGSCFMVNHLFDKWITTPVLFSFATQESPVGDIPFPAVTICPETKISRKCVNYTEILRERKKGIISAPKFQQNLYFDLMAVFCKGENHENTTETILRQALSKSSGGNSAKNTSSSDQSGEVNLDDYSEFLAVCAAVNLDGATRKWMGRRVECKDVMFPVLTDEGLCYTFNMYDVRNIYSHVNSMGYYPEDSNRRRDWDPDEGYQKVTDDLENMYPRRAFQSGANNGFTAIFVTQKQDMNYACQDFSTQGLRVSLHMPTRLARPGQVFFSVGLDRLTTAAVIPSSTSTSKKIRSYDPDKRGCYFGHERPLKYFQFYSQGNCNLECWTNYTLQQCGCVNFYMPRDIKTEICNLKRRPCIAKARKSYTRDILEERLESPENKKNSAKITACDCLPLCDDLIYNAEVATTDWRSTDADEASSTHSSAVKVYFKNKYFLPTRRNELYGFTDLVSNIGGTLGLFMGFSLISLSQIVYFLSVRLIDNYKRYGYWAGSRS